MGAFSDSQGILFDLMYLKYFCKCPALWTIVLTLINQQFKVATVSKPKQKLRFGQPEVCLKSCSCQLLDELRLNREYL